MALPLELSVSIIRHRKKEMVSEDLHGHKRLWQVVS